MSAKAGGHAHESGDGFAENPFVERLLPDGIALNFEAFMADINMLVQFGGRERTSDEFAALFKSADLCLARVIPTGTIFQIVEAVPA